MIRFNTKSIDFVLLLIFLFLTVLSLLIKGTNSMNNLIIFLIDVKGNILGTIVASFFFNCFELKRSFSNRLVISVSTGIGLIIYEFMQMILPWATFDKNDILGTLLGIMIVAIISLVIYLSELKLIS